MRSAHPQLSFDSIVRSGASNALLPVHGSSFLYTYSGRTALFLALRALARRGRTEVLVPSFHCPTVVTPVLAAGLNPVFYRIDRNLQIDDTDLSAKLSPRACAVIAINYFGFAADLTALLEARRKLGFALIEDCSHSFLNAAPLRISGQRGDITVYSFWKLVPSLVGGGLATGIPGLVEPRSLTAPPFRESLVQAKRLIEQAVNHLDGSLLKSAFNAVEALRLAMKRRRSGLASVSESAEHASDELEPLDPRLATARAPWLSRQIVAHADLSAVVSRRRRNFQAYLDHLEQTAPVEVVHRALPADTCPWAFPILLHSRDQIDFRLRDAGVALFTFGKTLHPASAELGDPNSMADAEFLSKNLLCLAVHQELQQSDIQEHCDTINRFGERPREHPAAIDRLVTR